MYIPESLQGLALNLIGERVRSITGSQSSLEDFKTPRGDRGLYGPESVVWKVHAHFTAMMVGGLSSLIVQSLHPRALAAVWDHSNFRGKLKERLGRTAYFVAATTYGSEALAMGVIQKVNHIHARISGVDLNGRPYVANEPELLKWVHLVEAWSFLSAYQHLSKQALSASECDTYMKEMSLVGHWLGATDLPLTQDETEVQMRSYKDSLAYDARAQEIVRVIEAYPTDWFDKPFMDLVMQTAMDIMPDWALLLMGRQAPCALQVKARRLAMQVAAEPVQWMLDQQGVAAIARQRVMASSGAAITSVNAERCA